MELELKFSIKSDLISKIEKLRFKKVKTSHQLDIYYIVNEIVNEKRTYLRIRKDKLNEDFSFDLHQVESVLATNEIEIPLNGGNNFLKIDKILKILGYDVRCRVDKIRNSFKKNDISIVIDKVKGLGKFIEIEIEGKETDYNQKRMIELVNYLGLDYSDRISKKGYPDLLLEKRSKI